MILKSKLWSSIELHIFRLYDKDGMSITMIIIAIPLLVLIISDAYVVVVQRHVRRMIYTSEAHEKGTNSKIETLVQHRTSHISTLRQGWNGDQHDQYYNSTLNICNK